MGSLQYLRYIQVIPLVFLVAVLAGCTHSALPGLETNQLPINLMPMYGYPENSKTPQQKKADANFVKAVTSGGRTRDYASKEFASRGWFYLKKGDFANSMRRFNQSWLLTPDYFIPHWGFGVLVKMQDKVPESIAHFERALALIDSDPEKPNLLMDMALAYMSLGDAQRSKDTSCSSDAYVKAVEAINQALDLNPNNPSNARAYSILAVIYDCQGKLEEAREMVEKAQALGFDGFEPGFLDHLNHDLSHTQ